MKTQLTFVHTLSPLHVGIGQGTGVIDLPIAREKATGIPFLPGSSTKGALRTRCTQEEALAQYAGIFGSAPSDVEETQASSVQFSDQRLLLLPIRSIAGTFAWVTSPYILRCFVRSLAEVQHQNQDVAPQIPQIDDVERCIVTGNSLLRVKRQSQQERGMVYLEDFDLQVNDHSATHTGALNAWAEKLGTYIFPGEDDWKMMLVKRLCLVHDDLFQFMYQQDTEINARIRLQDDTKAVTSGGLWYEEALPAETILSGIAMIYPVVSPAAKTKFDEATISRALSAITEKTIQFGGKATVGRGLCKVQLV